MSSFIILINQTIFEIRLVVKYVERIDILIGENILIGARKIYNRQLSVGIQCCQLKIQLVIVTLSI